MSAQSFSRIRKYIRLPILAVIIFGIIATVIVGTQSAKVDAAACNQNYFGVIYNDPTFFSGLCPDAARPFPNTGVPFVGNAFTPMNGNYDSVGYVIPRTSKDISAGSEALAGVTNKANFIARLQWQYNTRTDAVPFNTTWAKNGAAFVVLSLIGKNQSNRNLTAADWTELSTRLNNPNVTMTLDDNYPLSPNSAAVYDSAGNLDFTHFSDSEGLTGPSFVFRLNGNIIGSIERKCANLMGKFSLPEANMWTIRGESYVDNMSDGTGRKQGNPALTAKPSQALEWDHDLRNNSTFDMDRNVFYNVDRLGFTNGWDASHVQSGNAKGAAGVLFVTLTAPGAANSRYIVQASDGGRTLCQRISWNDKAWNDTGWGSSAWACADVPFNYNLTPSVTGPSGIGTVGGPIPTVTPRINNQLAVSPATTTDSPAVEWQLKRVEVAPGAVIPLTQQENGSAPCTHYGNNCIAKGSGTRTFPAGSTTLAALSGETIGANTAVGTRICYTLSVRPYSQANGNWRHSAPVCIKVSKQPKMQVWGHDVRTRGGIETGTVIINSGGTDKLFGSWVEYGGFSVGANDGFSSAAGLNNGNTSTDGADVANVWNKLTFANVDNNGSTSYGRYTLDALPKITDQFIGAPSGGVFNSDLGALNSGTYSVGSVTINASSIGQSGGVGKSIIIVSSGTVTIAGDITYTGVAGNSFTSITQIPQVVIIAKDIGIVSSVKNVDAWLLTTLTGGAINTCSDVPLNAALNSNKCKDVLTVNGPVATQHLHLRRTAGSDSVAAAGSPAEVFNLRPDAYMWAYARASQAGKAQTVYSVELPPRF